MDCASSGSNLAAIFEEKHLRSGIFAIIEPERAVASDVISAHAAARAPAVHLMNPEPAPSIERAPSFHENRLIRLCLEHRFQDCPFHFPEIEHPGAFQFCVIQSCDGKDSAL